MKWLQVKALCDKSTSPHLFSCKRARDKNRNSHSNQIHLDNNCLELCWNYSKQRMKPWTINYSACTAPFKELFQIHTEKHTSWKRVVWNYFTKKTQSFPFKNQSWLMCVCGPCPFHCLCTKNEILNTPNNQMQMLNIGISRTSNSSNNQIFLSSRLPNSSA